VRASLVSFTTDCKIMPCTAPEKPVPEPKPFALTAILGDD
jgi:hypothetical protein